MSPDWLRRVAFPRKLIVLLAAPLFVAVLVPLVTSPASPVDPAGDIEAQRELLQRTLDRFLDDLAETAEASIAGSPEQALFGPAALRLGQRLEGVGLLGPESGYQDWAGSPAEPPLGFTAPDWPRWIVRMDGARTRVLARGGPDAQGRSSLATAVIDSTLDDLRFSRLLETRFGEDRQIEIEFLDSREYYPATLADPDARVDPEPPEIRTDPRHGALALLRTADGLVVAVAAVAAQDTDRLRARTAAAARAAAVVLLLVLLVVLFDWGTITRRPGSLGFVLVLIGTGRVLLAWSRLPARILPRELSTAGLYGTSQMGDLLASPADLLLTALAFLLACLALRNAMRHGHETYPRTVRAAAVVLPVSASLAALWLTLSIVRDSRIPWLERPVPLGWDHATWVWLGLALVLIGVAELWGTLPLAWRREARMHDPAGARVGVVVSLVSLSIACGLVVQWNAQRLNLERLGSEYAPQILGQTVQRTAVLRAAVSAIRDRYEREPGFRLPLSSQPDFDAYRWWVDSTLFRSGYRSSLDLYSPSGDRIGHFSFDLPSLDDPVLVRAADTERMVFRREAFPALPSLDQELLHAESQIHRGQEYLGVVVGHLLDEPENLPFLPWTRPYLAALGPGAPVPDGAGGGDGPEYVLYDRDGSVELTTLQQPPAISSRWPIEGSRDIPIRADSGGQPHVGLALTDEVGRRHVLLIPALTGLDRLAAAVRLSLFDLLLFACVSLTPWILRPWRVPGLLVLLRRSFYRKLLVAVLIASGLPLVGLALFLQGYIERRADATLISSATQVVSVAKRVVKDYFASGPGSGNGQVELNDDLLYWLRRVVGQEIHVYSDGILKATSKRELFSSGLLPLRLDGDVQKRLVEEGLPTLVARSVIGPSEIPVAYSPVRLSGTTAADLVVAVPLVLEQRQIAQSVSRVNEMILIATVALAGLLALAAAFLARTVARPVRELVAATDKIAGGDYATRLEPRTEDEVAELVRGFNAMASALSRQRADIERRRDYIEALLRHATTGVISVDVDQRVVTLNPAAAQLLEPVADRLVAGSLLVDCLDSSDELAPLARALREPVLSAEPIEIDLERPGKLRRYRLIVVDLRNAAGESFGRLILLDDVTELMQSNQLAAWAEMARVIAHEIKNPLTPIQLSSEHLRRLLHDRGLFPAADIEACIDTIVKQVRALYDIAGEFSTYAKLPMLSLQASDPVGFMRGVVDAYRAASPPGIRIEERYGPAPAVAIDTRVLSRAVINLIENALQAMDGHGTLTAVVEPDPPNDAVVLSIADDGPGLDDTARRRLFEPYFSTKSSGTGLGLAIVQRAVEAHRGAIDVESEPGRGTVFRIRLPVHPTG